MKKNDNVPLLQLLEEEASLLRKVQECKDIVKHHTEWNKDLKNMIVCGDKLNQCDYELINKKIDLNDKYISTYSKQLSEAVASLRYNRADQHDHYKITAKRNRHEYYYTKLIAIKKKIFK